MNKELIEILESYRKVCVQKMEYTAYAEMIKRIDTILTELLLTK